MRWCWQWTDAGNKGGRKVWGALIGHHILSLLFKYFIGRYDYCRIALLRIIFNSSIGIFKFWIINSNKVCLRYRKEEIHTFVVSNYWYHRSVQSSGTTFVSALRFAEKCRDDNFRGKFCDFIICLCEVRVRTSTSLRCFLLNARNGQELKKRLDCNHSFGRRSHSRSWFGSCGTPSPCAPPRSASPLWYPHKQQDLLWKASSGHISPETWGDPGIFVFI